MLILKFLSKHKPLLAMEEHKDKLNGICRLCRKAIKLDQRYVNKKVKDSYKAEILGLFIYDIENEVAGIHPKSICDNYRKKLDMAKKKIQGRVYPSNFDVRYTAQKTQSFN